MSRGFLQITDISLVLASTLVVKITYIAMTEKVEMIKFEG